jgi:hypothetical protein
MIDNKVVTLQGTPVTDAELPTYDVASAEMVEEVLAEIKRGEVVGLAIVLLRPNDVVSTRRVGNSLRLLAGAARLHHRINRDCDGDETWNDPKPTPVPDGA